MFDPDPVQISQNVKHESCRSASYLSIASWISSNGVHMRELFPIDRDVSKLSDFVASYPFWRILYFLLKEVNSFSSLLGDDVKPKRRGFGQEVDRI